MAKKKAAVAYSLASEIKRAITSKGLTSYAVGQLAGVNPTLISRFLNGERGLTLASADKIIAGLGLRLVEDGKVKGKGNRA